MAFQVTAFTCMVLTTVFMDHLKLIDWNPWRSWLVGLAQNWVVLMAYTGFPVFIFNWTMALYQGAPQLVSKG